MDNQQTVIQNVDEQSSKKKLLLPILAASLSGGSIALFVVVAILLPIVMFIINGILSLIGLIPFIGLPFNLLSMLLSVVSAIGSWFTPFINILCFLVSVAGIVIGIVALVKSRANNVGTLYKVLSILAIVFGALAIVFMIITIIISIIVTMISFVVSLVMFALSIVSLVMG